ncbi:MAG: bifunctional [glutamine synthetase] adenylyltransferase/[glutamine synthetase]-adenylyl-L-tyrosine phosphorylase [Rhodobacteraceae bacterium]|nr:bifunctional [glutamine synthetase] adenylyltransferase/[glutamine synthetase]-adenylyl-L-tyrosine phosphorylase [Paracoccaceae bacterium]
MALKDLIKTAPLAYEPEFVDEALALFDLSDGTASRLIAGMAGSSPYLRGLLHREADWFGTALKGDQDQCFDSLLTAVTAEAPEDLAIELRRAKRRAALLLAACDLGGIWPLEIVTRRLTELADFATHAALKSQIRREQARGKLPGVGEDDIADCAGIAVLAMGKMGAFELNYSSDIDLILVFDETRHAPENYDDVRAGFLRATRNMSKMLSDLTADGYVFRTDLRLRPNPSVTPVCVPMDAAEHYYESEGRTWERAAFIKARPCAGDISGGERFLGRIGPFVWRKHLDFVAIQDAHDMRLRIRDHKGLGGPIELGGHDMKLGRGGIREIEFFAQTQQLIAGGRDRDLRANTTTGALTALTDKGWVPQEVSQRLTDAYTAHRQTEHRIQMLRDAQTHLLPVNRDDMDRLARLSGWADTHAFCHDIHKRLTSVHKTTEQFFAAPEDDTSDKDAAALSPDLVEIMDSWAGLPALRSPRAVGIFERLRPDLATRLAASNRPKETLLQLDTFVRNLPAGVQLFSMFKANPQLLDLLVDICSTAPSLATYLSRNTGVLDAVLTGRFFEPFESADDLHAELNDILSECADYEDALNATRRWFKEHHFRIGVLVLRKLATLQEAESAYSDLAQACVQALLPVVITDFSRRYGGFSGQQMAVLAMGKLGSRQMTPTSDLDLIVIYVAEGDFSEGKKELAKSTYFSRLTQSLITALSSPMAEGSLYEVDMRLRPSGRTGTVATALTSFTEYQHEKAWTWEHMALTRARVIAGDQALAERINQVRMEVIGRERDADAARSDVRDMRSRLAEAKSARAGDWDVKDRAGGLLDIELLAQMLTLLGKQSADEPKRQLDAAAQAALIDRSDADELIQAHQLFSAFQHAHRLLYDGAFDPNRLGRDGMDFVLSVTNYEHAEDIQAAIVQKTNAAEQIILRYLH